MIASNTFDLKEYVVMTFGCASLALLFCNWKAGPSSWADWEHLSPMLPVHYISCYSWGHSLHVLCFVPLPFSPPTSAHSIGTSLHVSYFYFSVFMCIRSRQSKKSTGVSNTINKKKSFQMSHQYGQHPGTPTWNAYNSYY